MQYILANLSITLKSQKRAKIRAFRGHQSFCEGWSTRYVKQLLRAGPKSSCLLKKKCNRAAKIMKVCCTMDFYGLARLASVDSAPLKTLDCACKNHLSNNLQPLKPLRPKQSSPVVPGEEWYFNRYFITSRDYLELSSSNSICCGQN